MLEKQIEENFINQLSSFGWETFKLTSTNVKDKEQEMFQNIKFQLSKQYNHNFSDAEFKQIKDAIIQGDNIYQKAKILRETIIVKLDNEETMFVDLINKDTHNWCKNQYQILSQVHNKSESLDIYDVVLLVNGIPLVHVELKNPGVAIKEAFEQIKRYNTNLLGNNSNKLFQFIQLNVISNNENTKYFANNDTYNLLYKDCFVFTDEKNKQINKLSEFTNELLEPCKLTSLINEMLPYSHKNNQKNIILKPFQYHAMKKAVKYIIEKTTNMYIYHATGTGKTLTSYRLFCDLAKNKAVQYDYVVLLVDRKSLGDQTVKEFNYFNNYEVNSNDIYRTNDGKGLLAEFTKNDGNKKAIITTIQQMSSIASEKKKELQHLKNKKVIYIIDECHRSTFGSQLVDIKMVFSENRLIGFTGTPIYEKNKIKNHTTADFFGECIHTFGMLESIQYNYILPLKISYFKTKLQMDKSKKCKTGEYISVEEEFKNIYDSYLWDEYVVDRILEVYDDKSVFNKQLNQYMFNSMIAKSTIENACNTYKLLKEKSVEQGKNLKIALVFSQDEATPEFDSLPYIKESIDEFNLKFNTQCNYKTSTGRELYAQKVKDKFKEKELDVLIVVEMFLTGYDAPCCNTLFYDRSDKYHNLIQAFNRTTRTAQGKDQGNIVCFKDIQEDVEDALKLYNGDNFDKCLKQSLEDFEKAYNIEYNYFISKYPNIEMLDQLYDIAQKREFCKAFSALSAVQAQSIFYKAEGFEKLMDDDTYQLYLGKYKNIYVDIKEQTGGTNPKEKDEADLNEHSHALWLTYNVDVSMLLLMSGKNKEEFTNIVKTNNEYSKEKKEMLINWLNSTEYLEYKNSENSSAREKFEIYKNKRFLKELEEISKQDNFNLEKLTEAMYNNQYSGLDKATEILISSLNDDYNKYSPSKKTLLRNTFKNKFDILRDVYLNFNIEV